MRHDLDRPVHSEIRKLYGSDAIAEMMRRLGTPYVALNPGSSFRGLHDSIVNYLGNRDPQMLLCLHEEHAVAIAHGWAKVTGKPLSVILHANVGLMHASMAIYNAWCDRVPMVIYGATGPVDAAKRRPWIDWIHTSRDQAALIRPYVKWDDQPASLAASLTSMLRASVISETSPKAPTYVCFDVSVQEEPIDEMPVLPDPAQHAAPRMPEFSEADAGAVHQRLARAEKPVFLMGRVSRDQADWDRRVALAEHFGARVVTDIKTGAAFPTRHPLHVGSPSYFVSPDANRAIAEADVVVCFDWVDPGGTLRQAGATLDRTQIVNITLDQLLANGWSLDHMSFTPSELSIIADPDDAIRAICAAAGLPEAAAGRMDIHATEYPAHRADALISIDSLADTLGAALVHEHASLLRLTLSWNGSKCDFRGPLDYLGYDGGAGIGSGPGMAVGSALALRGVERLPVAVLGDGDFLMGATAIWTAAHHEIPMIVVVANNRSYFNDEVHQERVAKDRDRPVENKHVGQAISEPDIDIAAIAEAQGATAFGPVWDIGSLRDTLQQAIEAAKSGRTVVVDVRVEPGYSDDMAEGMTNN
ncbi:thiamine pyrophosphate-binding protein [Roseivivax sp. THAF30]|uniref:thiamine pyrophosphate-binding protein n=1 Tax=Roseivivax sp. THAF30 TaxID=2587852 RepID=UPI001267F354|nr:thiamine pyrophosphate-binding protein [Roseivivax sp. THAF30]QFT62007.1 Benzoylformate decarboxylase [Roseivivax sp. THAF30]